METPKSAKPGLLRPVRAGLFPSFLRSLLLVVSLAEILECALGVWERREVELGLGPEMWVAGVRDIAAGEAVGMAKGDRGEQRDHLGKAEKTQWNLNGEYKRETEEESELRQTHFPHFPLRINTQGHLATAGGGAEPPARKIHNPQHTAPFCLLNMSPGSLKRGGTKTNSSARQTPLGSGQVHEVGSRCITLPPHERPHQRHQLRDVCPWLGACPTSDGRDTGLVKGFKNSLKL